MFLKTILPFALIILPGLHASAISTPSVSANTLFLYRNSNFHKDDANATSIDSKPNGINLREAELQFFADVDPYTRLNAIFAISPSYAASGTAVTESWKIEPEEVFAESNTIPETTLKIGKFKAFMGKHNTLHTHAYTFIEAPLANNKLLGDEGLSDPGVSAAVLMPSKWFNELTLQYLRGRGENDSFNTASPGGGVGLAHWKNLFDLSDDLTMEIGLSYASGGNSNGKNTNLSGGDLTFKWRPASGGRYKSVLWATEYLSRIRASSSSSDEIASGIATWAQLQFAERWSSAYRYDNLQMKNSFSPSTLPNEIGERHSLAFNYSPSEFSSYKLEYNQRTGSSTNTNNETTERSFFVQANFTIGSHPAHTY